MEAPIKSENRAGRKPEHRHTIAAARQHGGTVPTRTYTPGTGYTGDDSFTFTASDGTATSASATVSLVIYPPDADQTTSRLAITSPAEDTVILTQVEVQGFALDPDFSHYELQLRPVAAAGATASAWTTITSDIRRIGIGSTADALGMLNAGMMRNGLYELRVQLHTNDVTIAGQMDVAARSAYLHALDRTMIFPRINSSMTFSISPLIVA
ncbi:MAG: hypothetical protein LBK99_19060 [Opitutaceae bacterium]|jgi:hypothetical protein|nr:hypothetical protein [Opitutaceae bacterium]